MTGKKRPFFGSQLAKTGLKLRLLALRGKNQAIFAFHELTKKETPPKGCLMYLALSWEGFSFSTVPPGDYLLSAVATSTAQATVQPTIGLLPMQSFALRTERLSAYDP